MKISRFSRYSRSAGAVFAGAVAIALLSHGTDAILHASSVFPAFGQPMSDGLFMLAFAYRSLFNVFGCYLAARLAPRSPRAHALTLAGIGFVVSVTAALATWHRGPELGPHWYTLALVLSAWPIGWLGGALYVERVRHAAISGGTQVPAR